MTTINTTANTNKFENIFSAKREEKWPIMLSEVLPLTLKGVNFDREQIEHPIWVSDTRIKVVESEGVIAQGVCPRGNGGYASILIIKEGKYFFYQQFIAYSDSEWAKNSSGIPDAIGKKIEDVDGIEDSHKRYLFSMDELLKEYLSLLERNPQWESIFR